MRRLLYILLLLIPFAVKAQVPMTNDTVRYPGFGAAFTPSIVTSMYQGVPLQYIRRGTSSVYDLGVTGKYLRTFYYNKAHIDSAITNASAQNYDFTAPTTGTATITNTSLIGMYVYSVIRSGAEYDIITSGTPSGNSVLVNGATGAITFADNFNTSQAEKGHVRYKSIVGISPTAPTGLQILYADNYATAATFATGTGNKLIYVKNDEVNGGTNADGSFAATIYQYSNGFLQFYLRTGVN